MLVFHRSHFLNIERPRGDTRVSRFASACPSGMEATGGKSDDCGMELEEPIGSIDARDSGCSNINREARRK